jgi:CHAD domain-containing protein
MKSPQARLPRLAKEFFQEGRKAMKPGRTWSEMHEFRIAAKKFRYTLELFRPLYGDGLDNRLDSVKKIQQFLGDINDSVVTRGLIKDLKAIGPLRKKLINKAESKREEMRDYWRDEFDAPGELKGWKVYLVENVGPPKKTP